MFIRKATLVGLLALAGCAGVTAQPADPATTQRIVSACLASGLFKTGAGFGLSFAGPPGEIFSRILDAGVDKVCADPARYAADISTAGWVAKNLTDIVRRR